MDRHLDPHCEAILQEYRDVLPQCKTVAKEVFEALFKENADPEKYVEEHGLKMDNDEDGLKKIIEEIIEKNPKAVADYQGGNKKAAGAIVGQTMKATGGKANPQLINKIIAEILG